MKILPASILYFVLLPCAAFAQITLQLDPSNPVPLLLTGGSSFTLNLELNNQTGTGVAGYDVDVASLVYNVSSNTYTPVSNVLALTDVTLTSPALNLPNSNDPTAGSPAELTPQAGTSSQPLDLGASNLFTDETVGAGISPIETLSFQVATTAAPGIYELEFFAINGNAQGPVTISDDDGNSIGTASTPFYSNSFTVESAPEPSVSLLLAAALLALLLVMAFRHRFHLSIASK
jgi:hypothetical protein